MCEKTTYNTLDPNVPPVPSAPLHLHVLNKIFHGANFCTMCIKQTKREKKNPQRSGCITSYQGTGSSGTIASGLSRHVSFELYSVEEGTPPLWSGCISPPSLIPTTSSQNPKSERKQSVEAAALTECETDAKIVSHLPYDSTLMWHLLQTTNSLSWLKEHRGWQGLQLEELMI